MHTQRTRTTSRCIPHHTTATHRTGRHRTAPRRTAPHHAMPHFLHPLEHSIRPHGTRQHGLYDKQTEFELATRVPLLVRAPWKTASVGKHVSAFAELVDLHPTIASLAGLPVTPPMQLPEAVGAQGTGRDLSPVFDDPSAFVSIHPRFSVTIAARRVGSVAVAGSCRWVWRQRLCACVCGFACAVLCCAAADTHSPARSGPRQKCVVLAVASVHHQCKPIVYGLHWPTIVARGTGGE